MTGYNSWIVAHYFNSHNYMEGVLAMTPFTRRVPKLYDKMHCCSSNFLASMLNKKLCQKKVIDVATLLHLIFLPCFVLLSDIARSVQNSAIFVLLKSFIFSCFSHWSLLLQTDCKVTVATDWRISHFFFSFRSCIGVPWQFLNFGAPSVALI